MTLIAEIIGISILAAASAFIAFLVLNTFRLEAAIANMKRRKTR